MNVFVLSSSTELGTLKFTVVFLVVFLFALENR